MCRIVSSYKTSVAPGTLVAVHFADSAKASSTVHALLMMTPDHDPEVPRLFCPNNVSVTPKNTATVHTRQRLAMSQSFYPVKRETVSGSRVICLGLKHTPSYCGGVKFLAEAGESQAGPVAVALSGTSRT